MTPSLEQSGSVYSNLGPITTDQFQRALEKLGLGDFIKAEPTVGGITGQNVFVTSTEGEFVLRGKPLAETQFPRERFFAKALHDRTKVPVPWPYRFDWDSDIFGWSYALMPRLPGSPALDWAPSFSSEESLKGSWSGKHSYGDTLEVAYAIGKNLGLLQDLTWPEVGEYDLVSDTILGYSQTYGDWMVDFVRGQAERCQKLDCISTADRLWIDQLSADAMKAFSVPFQPVAVQNDYQLGNLLIDRKNSEWLVTGLYDLYEFRIGHPESDLGRTLGSYVGNAKREGLQPDLSFAKAFLKGYQDQKPFSPGYHERFKFHMLRDLLTMWEFFFSNPANQSFKKPFAPYAEECIRGPLETFD